MCPGAGGGRLEACRARWMGWRARWIWSRAEQAAENFYLCCRKAFSLATAVAASVDLSADSRYVWSSGSRFDLATYVVGVQPTQPEIAVFRAEPHPADIHAGRCPRLLMSPVSLVAPRPMAGPLSWPWRLPRRGYSVDCHPQGRRSMKESRARLQELGHKPSRIPALFTAVVASIVLQVCSPIVATGTEPPRPTSKQEVDLGLRIQEKARNIQALVPEWIRASLAFRKAASGEMPRLISE